MLKCMHVLKILIIPVFYLAILPIAPADPPHFPERMAIVERPFSTDPDKFTFAIIGDKTGGGLDKWPVFDRAVTEINALKPDFAIMVGDLIQGDTTDIETLDTEWKEFWQHESGLTVPFLPLPGNHDITNPVMYEYWKNNIGRTYSTFIYKNCLFVMLNTEEWHGPGHAEWDWEQGWFGTAQTEYVVEALARHSDVRHTFVMLHRPIWLYEKSGWERIETALGDRPYTVFAGHYHNLTLHTRNDRRYFVLSATGGSLTPRAAPEAGAFDHYSIVTVDGENADVAIIKPGNIYPADISTATFKAEMANLITFKHPFNIDKTQPVSSGTLDISVKNPFQKAVDVDLTFRPTQNWRMSPHLLSFHVKPGETAAGSVSLSVPTDTLTPLPIYDYAIIYGGERLTNGSKLFHPVDDSDMRPLKNWMLLGPFDLDITAAPANANGVPPRFLTTQLPKPQSDEGETEAPVWQEHIAETDFIDLDACFGAADWAFGYGVTHINAPEAGPVFAQMRWGCNLGRLFLNGVEIPAVALPGANLFRGWVHFQLPLQAGWNTLIVQSGDYEGGWNYRLEIADVSESLQFRAKPPAPTQ